MDEDHILIKEFNDGNIESFNELFKKYLNSTYNFFFKITGDIMVSEDLTNEVFLILFKKLNKFRYEAKFSTYFYRIKLNKANSWIARDKWKKLIHLDQIKGPLISKARIEKEYVKIELRRQINKLPKKQREIVFLRIYEQLSYKKIFELIGINENSAKVNYFHALKTLKRKMNYE